MANSLVVHGAIFAAGALVGGGIATTIVRKNETTLSQSITRLQQPVAPILQIGTTGDAVVTSNVGVVSPPLKYGNPGVWLITDQLVRKAYVAGYDRRLRHSAWAPEHLTQSVLRKDFGAKDSDTGDRSKSNFMEDESIPAIFRARLQDYFRSGYDRGHMVPAADAKLSQEAMDETFLLSNIAPQVGIGFNRHYWAYVEDWCRRLTRSFSDVYVFTIPLYLPKQDPDGKWRTHEVIGSPPNVAVPTHFAKVVLTTKPSSPSTPNISEISTGAFVLPNAPIPDEAPLKSFVVPVESVERASGLVLFSDAVKNTSKHICQTTDCQVVVRNFDDAQKKIAGLKGLR
ncbi:hypothetical protein BDM02DRAFT_3252906 [Thelephora ganbajun]|uniref:Uncharacterized protein n=1 Tax=Thelephora ganbajun TaxID=370292 RepID=A0ACB6ZBT9_THEGA|nr:hypothetical protein BDM02DRAFT_3252906 [Thelephora ganbajun]